MGSRRIPIFHLKYVSRPAIQRDCIEAHSCELTDSVGGFSEGEVLDVTARFGDWHTYELKLEPKAPRYRSSSVVVTEASGFSESERRLSTATTSIFTGAMDRVPAVTDGLPSTIMNSG